MVLEYGGAFLARPIRGAHFNEELASHHLEDINRDKLANPRRLWSLRRLAS